VRLGSRSKRKASFQYVFVVTYGRSGSTLVQGLLNTLPGTLVRGENGFYILPLFRAFRFAKAFKQQHQKHGSQKTSSAFFGLNEMRPKGFVTHTRDLVTEQLLGKQDPRQVQALGFKEVLWHRVNPGETEDFFMFMDDAFPGVKYVLNQRDHEQVVGSGFWQRFEESEAYQAIQRVEEMQEHLRSTRPGQVVDLRYEVITGEDKGASDAQLRSLAEFVTGSCDDALMDALHKTLETGHGPNPFGASRGRRDGGQAD
jgi:hypothetical protein